MEDECGFGCLFAIVVAIVLGLLVWGLGEIPYKNRNITLPEEPVVKQNLKKVLIYEWYEGYMRYRYTVDKRSSEITADKMKSIFQFSFNNPYQSSTSVYRDTKLSYEEFHKLVSSHTSPRELASLVNQSIDIGDVSDLKITIKLNGTEVAYLEGYKIYLDPRFLDYGSIHSKKLNMSFYFSTNDPSCRSYDLRLSDSSMLANSLLKI